MGIVDVVSATPERIRHKTSAILAPLTARERLVYSVLFLSFISLIIAPRIIADVGDEGSIFGVAATQCSSSEQWLFPENSTGQPSTQPNPQRSDLTADNSALWIGESGSIECGGYSPILEHTQINNAVRISVKAVNAPDDESISETNDTDHTTTNAAIQDGAILNERLESRPTPLEPNAFATESTSSSLDTLLQLSISSDDGQSWQRLHTFGSELLTATESVYDIAIPPQFTTNPDQLRFKFESVIDDPDMSVFLESMLWTYEVGVDTELSSKLINLDTGHTITDELPVLNDDEDLLVEIGLKDPNDGMWQGIRSKASDLVGAGDKPSIDVHATLIDSEGQIVAETDTEASFSGTDLSNTDTWQSEINIMPSAADPGIYTLRLDVTSTDGGVQTVTQDFLWGVLALNTDQDVYSLGEESFIQMGVLDETGATICNASLSLTISSPSGGVTMTNNNGITTNPSCQLYGTNIEPDYQANYTFDELGQHDISLTAATANGTYTIDESIDVVETSAAVIAREGPTRIFPLVSYPMRITVESAGGFSGTVTETVPIDFEISPLDFSSPYDSIAIVGDSQIISWQVIIEPGGQAKLGYSFDAPDISPEYYLLGNVVLKNTDGSEAYSEQRQWQIAGDAVDVFRTTTYELQNAVFTGTTYTLTLNNNLKSDYFPIIVGPSDATGSRSPDEDAVRVTGDPHSNYATVTSANQIELTRGDTTNDWIGTVTVVECLLNCATSGFALSEVIETSLATGTANAQQTVNTTLAANYTANTVPIGGLWGGGIETSGTDVNTYSATLGVKISKVNSDEIQFDRYGAESRVPAAADLSTYIVEWGSDWAVQTANVTGTARGSGIDTTGEYNTALITSVVRANTWTWGNGFNRDDGLGDGALGQVITLGDGVNQGTNETTVAVGGEGAMVSPGRDFQVYVMENSSLAVDYRFRVRGDTGAGSGFQALDLTVDAENGTESYDNVSASVQYTEGTRFPLLTTTSGGTGQAFSRTGAWGTRIDSSTNLNYYRAYAGQAVTGWAQVVDFGNIQFSNVDTRQDGFRWRDDSADLNTSSGWLAAEDTVPAAQDKLTDLRLRVRVENVGTTPEEAVRTYELQFAPKFGYSDCSGPTTWTGIENSSTDEFEMFSTTHIDPDGEATSTSHLSAGGLTYVGGEGRESADTTGNVGPMAASAYTELEYTVRPTTETVNGRTYCFRVYDTTAASVLDGYDDFPELTIANTQVTTDNGLGEVGTFTSTADGAFTTINFIGSYTTPVVVGVTNEQDSQNALEFEVDNVTSTSADIRVCESEGSTSNGCDTHAAARVSYMVIDAAVAATTPGIEAGTTTLSGGEPGTNISYPSSFTTTPYVFANVNTVNSTEFPISVVMRSVTTTQFNANICDHLLASKDACDTGHGNETVGWVAIEPGNEPFWEVFENNSQSIDTDGGSWVSVSYTETFADAPAMLLASQTDAGAQDVEIEGVNAVTNSGADIRLCEMDATDTCDSHAADTVAWHAMEEGVIDEIIELDQDGFRFYSNTNAIQPTVALGNEDASIANVDDGDVIRIRMALQNGDAQDLPVDSTDFTLQYAQATDCSSAGTWTDVGGIGSGTIWRGFNNGSPADEADITASLLDGAGNTLMTYEEENDSAPNSTQLDRTDKGEWDWVVENNGATDFTSYCFRMITVGNDTLQYSLYPRLTTSSGEAPLDPDDPASLGQEKTGGTSISVGDVINETTVVFTANVSDSNTSDLLELCVETQPIGTTFTNTNTACGTPVVYTGTAVAAEVEISGMQNLVGYHWQARVRDAAAAYSGWVSFGGNGETADDYFIDTEPPGVNVYDGTTTGVDIEYNAGDLDELSANWADYNGIQPDSLGSLAVWLDGMDIDGDGDTGDNPSNGSSITTWTDKSTNSNDAADTGFSSPTYDATNNTVEFADATEKLSATTLAGNTTGNTAKTFIVVHRLSGTADDDGGGVRYGTALSGTSEDLHLNETRRIRYGGGNDQFGPTLTSGLGVTTMTTSAGSAVNLEMFVNSVSQGNGADTSTWNFGDDLYLNADWTDSTQQTDTPGDISVAEVLLFDAQLSTNDREEIEEYLMCKWSILDCSNTYERSIGTSPGGTDVLAWISSGTSTSSTDTSLTLNTNQPYYYNIRATDIAGNQATFSSDGQFVAPTLTFGISGTTLDLGNINPGNSYTVTGTSTVTTSTNAYNGYVVRGYATGLLTQAALTIGMFDGGTYASPGAWLGGDTGYGYTSSDTSIQGSNIFNGGPCAGGGTPPCYAPWSLTAPGDIIADHTNTVSGTPVVSEQFTITHRVTTDASQTDGEYTTTIIYNITAKY